MLIAIKDNLSGEIYVGTPLEVHIAVKTVFLEEGHATSTNLNLLDDLTAAIVAGRVTAELEHSLALTVMEHPTDEDQ